MLYFNTFGARFPVLSHFFWSIATALLIYWLATMIAETDGAHLQAALFVFAMMAGTYDSHQCLRLERQIRPDAPYLHLRQAIGTGQIFFVIFVLSNGQALPSMQSAISAVTLVVITYFFTKTDHNLPPTATHLDPEKPLWTTPLGAFTCTYWPFVVAGLSLLFAVLPYDGLTTEYRMFLNILLMGLFPSFGYRSGWHMAGLLKGLGMAALVSALLWA